MCCLHVYLGGMRVPSAQEGWKRPSDTLERGFRMVVNHYMGARNQTWGPLQEHVLFTALHQTSLWFPILFKKTSKISRIEIFCSRVSFICSSILSIPKTSMSGFQTVSPHRILCPFPHDPGIHLVPMAFRNDVHRDRERLSSYKYLLILERTKV